MVSARWEMIEAGGRTAQTFGLSRLLGQLYMFLYLSDQAQSLDELAEGLGVSKASVSIACRQLESWGAVRKSWKKGDRKDYYEAESDFSRILNNGLLPSIEKKLDSAKHQIERSRSFLNQAAETEQQKAFLEQRLQRAEKFRSRIAGLIKNPIVARIIRRD